MDSATTTWPNNGKRCTQFSPHCVGFQLTQRYYFCGSVTMAWAFVVYFFLPNSPLDPGRFFNEEERQVLARRFEENPFGKDRQPFKLSQFIEAVLDYRTWVYMLMGAAIYVSSHLTVQADLQLCNGSVTAFGARIISGFGYDSLTTTALLIPGGAMTCVTASLPIASCCKS